MTDQQLTILFGSKTRVKLLRHFLKDPAERYYVRELTRILKDHINAIRHELGNLENAGLVSKQKMTGKLYYRLNQGAQGVNELRSLFTAPPPPPEEEPITGVSTIAGVPGGRTAPPDIGDVKLLVQNGKFVSSHEAPADLLIVGEVDKISFKEYIRGLEAKYGEVRFTVMTENEYAYRRQLFDRFITLMLSEPKKVVINNLRDRQLASV